MARVAWLGGLGMLALLAALALAVTAGGGNECRSLAWGEMSTIVGGTCPQCKTSGGGDCQQCVKLGTNMSRRYNQGGYALKCSPGTGSQTCTMSGSLKCGNSITGIMSYWDYNENCYGLRDRFQFMEYSIPDASGDSC